MVQKLYPRMIAGLTDVDQGWSVNQTGLRWSLTGGAAYFAHSGEDPFINYASTDYRLYDISADTELLVIGGTTKESTTATEKTLSVHIRFGADSTYDIGATGVRARVGYLDDLSLRPSASRTPAANGDVEIELTNNTTLTFKAKGSDGTVRSGTVTLS